MLPGIPAARARRPVRDDPARAFAATEAAGFGDLDLVTVDSRWRIQDSAAPFDFFIEDTVRGGTVLSLQPDAQKAAIRATAASGRAGDADGTGFRTASKSRSPSGTSPA